EEPVAERGVLYLSLESIGGDVFVDAELDGRKQSYTPAGGAELAHRLRALYLRLPSDEATQAELSPLLKEVGGAFFAPITAMLEAATEVRFIVPGKFLLFPLDLLHFKGQPLFLQKPVTYGFERLESGQFQFAPPRKALIIEDKAVNPKKCCQMLK